MVPFAKNQAKQQNMQQISETIPPRSERLAAMHPMVEISGEIVK
jgi:hypothetical protein